MRFVLPDCGLMYVICSTFTYASTFSSLSRRISLCNVINLAIILAILGLDVLPMQGEIKTTLVIGLAAA